MKLLRYILVLMFAILMEGIYAFGQNTNAEDTASFKNNLDHKNIIKFSGIYSPLMGYALVHLMVGYERALNKIYSAEIIYGGIGYGYVGGTSINIHSLHGGVKYYFSTTDFQKSKRSFNPYASLFVRYQKIFVHPDQHEDEFANGYGAGGGLGTVIFLTKKLFLECGYFAYYSYRDIGQTFSEYSDSAI